MQFYVEGTGQFAHYMLCHDRCWPVDVFDALKIAGTGPVECTFRSVHLGTDHPPSKDMWEKMGWKVVEQPTDEW